MKKVIVLVLFIFVFLYSKSNILALTVNNALSGSSTPQAGALDTWFVDNSLGSIDVSDTNPGIWKMLPVDGTLYFFFNPDVPTHDDAYVLFGSYDGTDMTAIYDMPESSATRAVTDGEKIYIPGQDPNSDWDAGNFYIYDILGNSITQKRYRSESYIYVDATTTDANGNYSFTGLEPNAYRIQIIKPADYIFTTASAGSNRKIDSNFDSNGRYTLFTDSYSTGLSYVEYFENTVDAGLRSSPGAAAGTPTMGTRNESFFTGDYSIGDLIWLDSDNDGIQDGGESGVAGVRVELYTKDPYFPSGIHMLAVAYNPDDNEILTNAGVHRGFINYVSANAAHLSNLFFKSTDEGEEWEPIYHDFTTYDISQPYNVLETKLGYRYFAQDLAYYKGKWFSLYEYFEETAQNFLGILLTLEHAYWAASIIYSDDAINWNTISTVDLSAPVGHTLSVPFGGSTLYAYFHPTQVDFRNSFIQYRDHLLLLKTAGNALLDISENGTTSDITFSSTILGDILPSFNDPDFASAGNDAGSGSSQRYNSVAAANDQYLYAIGSSKKIYATTNLREWIEVADFSAVDSGQPPISIEYWPNKDWVMVSTGGTDPGLYYFDHSDMVDEFFSKIDNNTNLSFYDKDESSVNLKTEGSVNESTVQVKDNSNFLAEIDTTLSSLLLDWTSVDGDSNDQLGKSYITNIASADGASATFSLFVPIHNNSNSTQVRVCPDAQNLADVTANCSNGVNFSDGESGLVGGDSVTVSIVTLSGQSYWKIAGVSGTGAIDLKTETPLTPAGPNFCTQEAPKSTPVIYNVEQINSNSVKINFYAAQKPVNYYYLQYGIEPHKYIYGANFIGDENSNEFVVSLLQPGATYYFQLRAGNGCMPGDWGNEYKFVLKNQSVFINQSQQNLDEEDLSFDDKNVSEAENQAEPILEKNKIDDLNIDDNLVLQQNLKTRPKKIIVLFLTSFLIIFLIFLFYKKRKK